MITDEQIKNLKPGDIVLVEAKVDIVKPTGITVAYGSIARPLPFNKLYPIPEQPKHNPCRLFKEGDIVDYRRALYGRDYETIPDPGNYKLARVISSENAFTGMVGVEFIAADGGEDAFFPVPWFHLELITPVEELEPYSVQESDAFNIVRDGKIVMTIPFTVDDYYNYEQAKDAAEYWCKRLNTEWQNL